MKTIRIILPFLLCLIQTIGSQAQPPQPGPEVKEEIESMRIAFFTRKLQLNPEEAKSFWPVFNGYSDELFNLRSEHAKKMRSGREKLESMNAGDLEKLADAELTFCQQELEIKRKYHSQFKQVLPAKKVVMLYNAEDEFKRELIGRLRERNSEGRPPHPPSRRHN